MKVFLRMEPLLWRERSLSEHSLLARRRGWPQAQFSPLMRFLVAYSKVHAQRYLEQMTSLVVCSVERLEVLYLVWAFQEQVICYLRFSWTKLRTLLGMIGLSKFALETLEESG